MDRDDLVAFLKARVRGELPDADDKLLSACAYVGSYLLRDESPELVAIAVKNLGRWSDAGRGSTNADFAETKAALGAPDVTLPGLVAKIEGAIEVIRLAVERKSDPYVIPFGGIFGEPVWVWVKLNFQPPTERMEYGEPMSYLDARAVVQKELDAQPDLQLADTWRDGLTVDNTISSRFTSAGITIWSVRPLPSGQTPEQVAHAWAEGWRPTLTAMVEESKAFPWVWLQARLITDDNLMRSEVSEQMSEIDARTAVQMVLANIDPAMSEKWLRREVKDDTVFAKTNEGTILWTVIKLPENTTPTEAARAWLDEWAKPMRDQGLNIQIAQ